MVKQVLQAFLVLRLAMKVVVSLVSDDAPHHFCHPIHPLVNLVNT
jgi:hypothetical protein